MDKSSRIPHHPKFVLNSRSVSHIQKVTRGFVVNSIPEFKKQRKYSVKKFKSKI